MLLRTEYSQIDLQELFPNEDGQGEKLPLEEYQEDGGDCRDDHVGLDPMSDGHLKLRC